MRLKIRCDWTGEPPGELTVIATLGNLEAVKAFSMAPASDAKARPGLNGVTMPIAPVKRKTGTIGPRLKKSIGCLAKEMGTQEVGGCGAGFACLAPNRGRRLDITFVAAAAGLLSRRRFARARGHLPRARRHRPRAESCAPCRAKRGRPATARVLGYP